MRGTDGGVSSIWSRICRVQTGLPSPACSGERNSASGPEIGLPGRISAGFQLGRPQHRPFGRPSAGRRADSCVCPARILPKSGPEDGACRLACRPQCVQVSVLTQCIGISFSGRVLGCRGCIFRPMLGARTVSISIQLGAGPAPRALCNGAAKKSGPS